MFKGSTELEAFAHWLGIVSQEHVYLNTEIWLNRSSRVRSLLTKNNWDSGSPAAEYGASKNLANLTFKDFTSFSGSQHSFLLNRCWQNERALTICFLSPFLLRNRSNSSDLSCGPLPLTNWAATPYLANNFWRVSMVFSEMVEVILSTSSRHKCASTATKNILLRNGPAKSVWIRCQRNCVLYSFKTKNPRTDSSWGL